MESLKSLTVTASLCPSSRFLASALLQDIDFTQAKVIVELGTGTGAITREILRQLRPSSVLYGVDINPAFVSRVRDRIHDSRFISILDSAENLSTIMAHHGIVGVDAVVSSLGLTSMAPEQRCGIIRQVAKHLRKGGVLTQYQYLHARFAEGEFLREYFSEVRSKKVVWNVPPATVYTCKSD